MSSALGAVGGGVDTTVAATAGAVGSRSGGCSGMEPVSAFRAGGAMGPGVQTGAGDAAGFPQSEAVVGADGTEHSRT